MIILTNSSTESISLVKKYFSVIPSDFFKYSEGVLKEPVIITVDQYKTFVECDSRYYQARLLNIKKIQNIDGELVGSSGCGTQYAVDMYMTSTKDDSVNLRETPSTSGKILKKLPNNTSLEKIKTVGNWFYVKLYEDDKTLGYVHKSQVRGVD